MNEKGGVGNFLHIRVFISGMHMSDICHALHREQKMPPEGKHAQYPSNYFSLYQLNKCNSRVVTFIN